MSNGYPKTALTLGVVAAALAMAFTPLDAQERMLRTLRVDNGYRIEMELHGDVEFSDDGAIASVDPGGRFTLVEAGPGKPTRRVEVGVAAGGGIEHVYSIDGVSRTFDAAASRWMAETLSATGIQPARCECGASSTSGSNSGNSSSSSSRVFEPPFGRPRR